MASEENKGISMAISPTNTESDACKRGDYLSDIHDLTIGLDNLCGNVESIGYSTNKKLTECSSRLKKLIDRIGENDKLGDVATELREITMDIRDVGADCYHDTVDLAYNELRQYAVNIRYDVIEERKKSPGFSTSTGAAGPDQAVFGVWSYEGTILEKRKDGNFIIREGSIIKYRLPDDYPGSSKPDESNFYYVASLTKPVSNERTCIRKNAAVFNGITRESGKCFAVYKLEKSYLLSMTGISSICSVICGYATSYNSQAGKFKSSDTKPLTDEDYNELKANRN